MHPTLHARRFTSATQIVALSMDNNLLTCDGPGDGDSGSVNRRADGLIDGCQCSIAHSAWQAGFVVHSKSTEDGNDVACGVTETVQSEIAALIVRVRAIAALLARPAPQ